MTVFVNVTKNSSWIKGFLVVSPLPLHATFLVDRILSLFYASVHMVRENLVDSSMVGL